MTYVGIRVILVNKVVTTNVTKMVAKVIHQLFFTKANALLNAVEKS